MVRVADSLRLHSRIGWGISTVLSLFGENSLQSPNSDPRHGSYPRLKLHLNSRLVILPLIMVSSVTYLTHKAC